MPTCLECNKPFHRRQYDAQFCSARCRLRWNNRRAARGTELYDAAMCLASARDDGALEEAKAIQRYINDCLTSYRAEDARSRGRRKSWLSWRHIRQRRPGGPDVNGDGR